ncbi:MAG TPA: phosphoribosyl transferase [Candidatus Margulisbacteria bacterium]|nr:MAG: phosphoribosyl transferase [Candidatus Margulisbacteria bacterium GWE2_39_32]HCT83876.1 phosphoribosyl transferase [Candidatus Margulisiibacteriota bacterium]
MGRLYKDRSSAGKILAARLKKFANDPNLLILGLPRGGIPVAFEVAKELNAPLDVFIVRKLGTPGQPELAMGAIAGKGFIVLNKSIVNELGIPKQEILSVARSEQKELDRREALYRKNRPAYSISGKKVILVDDGLATGATMMVAVRAVRKQNPEKLIVATPVADVSICEKFKDQVDEMICAYTPYPLSAIGMWYENFIQTTDAEVIKLLELAHKNISEEKNAA